LTLREGFGAGVVGYLHSGSCCRTLDCVTAGSPAEVFAGRRPGCGAETLLSGPGRGESVRAARDRARKLEKWFHGVAPDRVQSIKKTGAGGWADGDHRFLAAAAQIASLTCMGLRFQRARRSFVDEAVRGATRTVPYPGHRFESRRDGPIICTVSAGKPARGVGQGQRRSDSMPWNDNLPMTIGQT